MARGHFANPNPRCAEPLQATTLEGEASIPSLRGSDTSLPLAPSAPTPPDPTPGQSAITPRPLRCGVKGCIFPAASVSTGRCLVHDRAEKEPKHFLSVQPSILLLDQAKFGIPDPDYEDLRAQDRRRLAALRERFREEVA